MKSRRDNILVYSLFADETYCKKTDHVIVAGYLIGSSQLGKLTDAWGGVLEDAPLKYFHMKEGERTSHPDTYRALVNLVNYDHVTAGFCASVLRSEYNSVCRRKIGGQSLKYWMG